MVLAFLSVPLSIVWPENKAQSGRIQPIADCSGLVVKAYFGQTLRNKAYGGQKYLPVIRQSFF